MRFGLANPPDATPMGLSDDPGDEPVNRGFRAVKKYHHLVAVETNGVAHVVIDIFRRTKTGLRVHIACGRELFGGGVEAFDTALPTTCISCLMARWPWDGKS